MGLFDVFEWTLDAAISLPGKVVEGVVETVTRLPEIPIKMVKGVGNGVKKGIEKIEDALDK